MPISYSGCPEYSRAFLRKNGFRFFTEQDRDDETRLMFYDLINFSK